MKHLNINIQSYEKDGEIILSGIDTIINSNDRVAIVGANGIGKSTFLRIISGEITEYTGSVANTGSISLGYLEQIHFLDEQKSVRDELRDAYSELRDLEDTIKKEETNLALTGEYEKYSEALERYKYLGGYTYENEIERVARGISVFHLLGRKLSEVSGGERTKIALVKTLLSRPDFLLLDEPTNFIDLSSVEWLERYLVDTWKGGYMIVSHDREFLDHSVTKVMEIRGKAGISITHGDYSDSVREKREKLEREQKSYEEQVTMLESEKELINRFRAGSRAGFAKSREKMLDRVELIEKPYERTEIRFRFDVPKEKPPETLIQIEEVFIGRSDPLFFIREAQMSTRDRIGIVGENGVGKSTLIKTILGSLPYDISILSNHARADSQSTGDVSLSLGGGEPEKLKVLEGYLNISKVISVGYYSQMHESLQVEKTIEKNFYLHGLHYSKERIGSILRSFGFDYHAGVGKVGHLSGGERSRLLFAFLSERPYHLLILDEPTNHLDYETRETLEKAMRNYEGAILFISHDRYFVNKLAEKLWIIEDGELIISYGNYEDYRYKKDHGISLDMSLFDAEGEMSLVLEEKLGVTEARRIKEKFKRRKKRN